jgi:hypothetical protein
MFHETKVPVPMVVSTLIVSVVPEYAVTAPSIQTIAVLLARARSPTKYASPACVVNVFDPVPMTLLVVEVAV